MKKWNRKNKVSIDKVECDDRKIKRLSKLVKREILFTTLSIFVVAIVSIGSAYAIFSSTSESNGYNTVKSGTLEITYTDTESGLGDIINLNNAYPVSNVEGQAQTPYKFRVKNTGNIITSYKIKILDDEAMINADGCSLNQLDKSLVKVSINGGTPFTLSSLAASDYTIGTGKLNANGIKTYQIRVWLDENSTNDVLGKHFHGKLKVEALPGKPTGADSLLSKANSAGITDYALGTTTEMYAFSHNVTVQQTGWLANELLDYRYIGANPNNYVYFNCTNDNDTSTCETWRILGVFTVDDGAGNKEQRIKLVKNDSIGAYPWDTSAADASGGKGFDNWNNASIMKLLNEENQTESVGGSLYWNQKSGDCYVGSENLAGSCDFTTMGLTDSSKNKIDNAKWYLGNYQVLEEISGTRQFTYERGYNVNESPGNSVSWTGKVGLMYLSDYIYTYAQGVNTNCFSYVELCSAAMGGVPSSGWIHSTMFANTGSTLLISTGASNVSLSKYKIAQVAADGSATDTTDSNIGQVHPTVYLKSDIDIKSGTGTSASPYVLK